VFHLAAQPLVRLSYHDPVTTYATNVLGTVHLLEAARQVENLRAIVVVTSDKCYENREWIWGYRESDPLGGHDPYSSSKGCAELVTAAYRRSFFGNRSQPVGVASARAGNVIGGGDWAADRLVPDILRALGRGEEIVVRNPRAVRPWQHVLEPLRGYLMLAQRLVESPAEFAAAWNFGPRDDDARPVQELVQTAIELWGGGSWRVPPSAGAPHEARLLKLDCSQAREQLGWQPRLGLEAALELTVQWHRAERAGRDLRELTWQQIDDYQTLAAGPGRRPSDEPSGEKQKACHTPQSLAARAVKAA
jgi:CDP-glucose 4,6-dehydratase